MKKKSQALKKSIVLTSLLVCMALVISGCGGKSGGGSTAVAPTTPPTETTDTTANTTPEPDKVESIPVPNHNVKGLDIGILESFSLMAYTSITSAPASVIKGKIGLKPGARSLINLGGTTVSGGREAIYTGDDIDDRATYVSLAREEMIESYREAAARPTDKDKIEPHAGNVGGKILPPGIYKWSNGLTIPSDVTLEGTSKDVWIFQITGDVLISSGVKVQLAGGAKARNVFWQISGKVSIEENAEVPGTMISQLTFDMKNGAKLTGRALVKNGKLLMSNNTIEMP